MQTCPQCGGTSTSMTRPGLWRCNSLIVETYAVDHPGPPVPGLPLGHTVRRYHQDERFCNHEWADPQAVAHMQQAMKSSPQALVVCHCGTIAIGLCVNCESPVCLSHYETGGDGRLYCYRDACRLVTPPRPPAPLSEREKRRIAEEDKRTVLSEWVSQITEPGYLVALCSALAKAMSARNHPDFEIVEITTPYQRPSGYVIVNRLRRPSSPTIRSFGMGWTIRTDQSIFKNVEDLNGRAVSESIVLGVSGGWWLCTAVGSDRKAVNLLTNLNVERATDHQNRKSVSFAPMPFRRLEIAWDVTTLLSDQRISPSELGMTVPTLRPTAAMEAVFGPSDADPATLAKNNRSVYSEQWWWTRPRGPSSLFG